MEEEEELEREEEEEARQDAQAGGWLIPEAHFWVRAYHWTRQWFNPRHVRVITLGLHGCAKSGVLQRLQTGMPPLPNREPTVVPMWYEVPHKDTVFHLLDTSGFLNRKAVWQKHIHSEGMGAIIFVIDADDRAGFEAHRELFQGPLLTAVREVPSITSVLVLLHSPHKDKPTREGGEGEGGLDIEEVARGLELLQDHPQGDTGDKSEAPDSSNSHSSSRTALLRRRSSRAGGGRWGVMEGQRGYAIAGGKKGEGQGGLSSMLMLSPSLLLRSGEERRREVQWRVQGCGVESGEGLRRALHWLWTTTTQKA